MEYRTNIFFAYGFSAFILKFVYLTEKKMREFLLRRAVQSEINMLSGAPCLQNSTHNDQLLTKLLDVQNTAFLL